MINKKLDSKSVYEMSLLFMAWTKAEAIKNQFKLSNHTYIENIT